MKLKLGFSVSTLAVISLACSLNAVEDGGAKPADQTSANQINGGQFRPLESLGEVAKASEVIGEEVKNLQGEKLGKIEDLAVDLGSGRIVYVVVSRGGMMGMGSKNVAVTPQLLRWVSADKIVQIDVSKEKLNTAPALDLSKWDDASHSNRVVEIYRYYEQRPYFLEPYLPYEGKRIQPSVTPLGYVTRASKLVGTSVKNNQDENLGTVNELIINLQRGRLAQVIISSGGFLGLGDELSALPPRAFRYDSSRDFLRVDATKDDLSRAPHFAKNQWPNFGDPQYATSTYRAYHVEPYFSQEVNADNTRRNARDQEDHQLTPLDQGATAADVNTTRRIRQQLVAQDNLSVNARNVKVITVDGQVTLRGPVNSEEEKRQVAEIASRVASSDRLSNQLEVKKETN